MRFMMLVKADERSEAGVMPTEEEFAKMGRYNEELVKAGVLLAGDGLHPSSAGARVRFSGGKPTVIDGPFPETKELIAGYWIIQVKSREEAIEWARRVPFVDGEVEVRRIYETEDFGDAITPELRAQEERLRAEVAAQQQAKA
ncbi:MAG TPA: YciI family protein [Longimicrobiales bacterium]